MPTSGRDKKETCHYHGGYYDNFRTYRFTGSGNSAKQNMVGMFGGGGGGGREQHRGRKASRRQIFLHPNNLRSKIRKHIGNPVSYRYPVLCDGRLKGESQDIRKVWYVGWDSISTSVIHSRLSEQFSGSQADYGTTFRDSGYQKKAGTSYQVSVEGDWQAGFRIRIDLMRIRIRIRIHHFF